MPNLEDSDVEKQPAGSDVVDTPPEDKAKSQYLYGWKLYLVLIGLGLALFLGALDMAVLSTAVPSITSSFHKTSDIGWYGAAYPLAMCSLQPVSGKMYSIFPQKTTFLTYFGLFMFGSLLCGVSVSSNMFIVGRAVAGSGAAGVLSGTLSIISVITSLDKQALYVGLLMSLVGTAVVLGPVIGGALTESATWRWCFYLNLPCGAVTFLALLLFFRPPERQNKTPLTLVQKVLKLDLIGCFLFIPAIIMILLALQWGGGNYAWNSSVVIGLFCGAGAILIVFLFWEYRQGDAAMLPLSLLTDLSIISSCLYGLFLLGAYVTVGYYLPEWFQIVKGASPEHSAVMLLPNIISNFIFKALCGVIISRTGIFNPWMFLGAASLAIGSGLETNFTTTTSHPSWIGFQVLQGAALGVIQAPTLAVQTALVDKKHLIAVGLSLVVFFQYFGSSIMLSISLTVFQNILIKELQRRAKLTPAQVGQYLAAGNVKIRDITQQIAPSKIQMVLEAYNEAITKVMWVPVAASCLAFLVSFGVPWKNIKGQPNMVIASMGAKDEAPEKRPEANDEQS